MNIKPQIYIPILIIPVIVLSIAQWLIRIERRVPIIPNNPKSAELYIWGRPNDTLVPLFNNDKNLAVSTLRNGYRKLWVAQTPFFPWVDDYSISLAPIGYGVINGIRFKWYGSDDYLDKVYPK